MSVVELNASATLDAAGQTGWLKEEREGNMILACW
jgi:hypothetical protein